MHPWQLALQECEGLPYLTLRPTPIINLGSAPTVSASPAISWYVDVMMKSDAFMAMRSAVNWQLKWYCFSSFFLPDGAPDYPSGLRVV